MKSVMAPFYTEFPELADNETRCLTVLNDENLPKGKYAFIESYCDDIDCDCRRVLLSVHCPEVAKKKMLATISYGWERASFYKQFCLDGDDPKTVKGPYLDPLNPQSKYAPYLLELFKTMLKNRNYVERLKRHYKLFKKAVKEKQKPQETAIKKPVKKIGRNEPCPCGSGKKYKKCCGR